MLRRWLETDAVTRWWGDPATREGLLREDMADGVVTMLVASYRGRPFAYAQHCDVHAWARPIYGHLPAATRAIDMMIGEPDMVGRGHGSAVLRQLAERMTRDGHDRIVIDPAIGNHRARRAYGRAGFVGGNIVANDAGHAVIMTYAG